MNDDAAMPPSARATTAGAAAVTASRAGTLTERLLDRDDPAGTGAIRHLHDGRATSTIGAGDLGPAVLAAAATWRAAGARPGDPVAIVGAADASVYVAFLGAIVAGAIPAIWAPPSPKQSAEDHAAMIAGQWDVWPPRVMAVDASCRAPIVAAVRERANVDRSAGAAGLGEPGGSDPRTIDLASMRAGDGPAVPPTPDVVHAARPDDIAFLQYSSGTTGRKKAVAITHRALLDQLDRYAATIDLDASDRVVSWLPLYHDMGLVACFLLPVAAGAPVVAIDPFEWVRRPAMWLEAISDARATLAWMPNFAFAYLARVIGEDAVRACDLSSLRGVVNCAEPLSAEAIEAFESRFTAAGLRSGVVGASYAMAESVFALTSGGFATPLRVEAIDGPAYAIDGIAHPVSDLPLQSDDGPRGTAATTRGPATAKATTTTATTTTTDRSSSAARRLVSSGCPLPGFEVRVVDDHGAPCADGMRGTIEVRGPSMMLGYVRDGVVERAPGREPATGDAEPPWHATGDVGYRRDGHLFVTGRSIDRIIVRGQNLDPEDIEAAVADVAGVVPGRAAAIGVPDPSAGTERLVVLVETRADGPERRTEIGNDVTAAITRRCGLAPDEVVVVDHMWLRKSTSGKLARPAIRDRYLLERDGLRVPASLECKPSLRHGSTPGGVVLRDADGGRASADRAGVDRGDADSTDAGAMSVTGAEAPDGAARTAEAERAEGIEGSEAVDGADHGDHRDRGDRGDHGDAESNAGGSRGSTPGAPTPSDAARRCVRTAFERTRALAGRAAQQPPADAPLVRAGWLDSLDLAVFYGEVERQASIRVPTALFAAAQVESIDDVARLVDRRWGRPPGDGDGSTRRGGRSGAAGGLIAGRADGPMADPTQATRRLRVDATEPIAPAGDTGPPSTPTPSRRAPESRPAHESSSAAASTSAPQSIPASDSSPSAAVGPIARSTPITYGGRGAAWWTRRARRLLEKAGARIDRDFRVLGPVLLRLDGRGPAIRIGRGVTIWPNVDLKTRERGTIHLADGAVLDTGVRLVAAHDACIELGPRAQLGCHTVVNAGADVRLEADVAVAGGCTIVSSEHRYMGSAPILEQGYEHAPVAIGAGAWIAANAFIGRGTTIGRGAVIGAGSMVRGDVPDGAVVIGHPGRVVRFRDGWGQAGDSASDETRPRDAGAPDGRDQDGGHGHD